MYLQYNNRRPLTKYRILVHSNRKIKCCPIVRTDTWRSTLILSLLLVSPVPTKGGLVPFIATMTVELSALAKTWPRNPCSSHPKSVDSFHLCPKSYHSSVSGI